MRLFHVVQGLVVGSALLAATELFGAGGAIAQQALPACQPPRANEYLLLVPNRSPETQAQIQKLLPGSYIKHAGPDHLLQKEDLDETNPPVQYPLPSLPPPDAHSTYPIVYVSDRRQPS